MAKVFKSIIVLFVFMLLFSQNIQQASAATDRELLILSHAAYYPYSKDTDPTRAPVFSITNQLDYINHERLQYGLSKLDKNEMANLYNNWKRVNRADLLDFGNGFSGSAFYNFNTSELVFAFRGSEEINDFANDADILTRKLSVPQINRARDFVKQTITIMVSNGIIRKEKANSMAITITGHSLGGYLAQKIGMDVIDGKVFSSVINKNQAVRVVTFNPLGFRKNSDPYGKTEQQNDSKGIYSKYMRHYVIDGDIANISNKFLGLKMIGTNSLTPNVSALSKEQKKALGDNIMSSHRICAFYYKM